MTLLSKLLMEVMFALRKLSSASSSSVVSIPFPNPSSAFQFLAHTLFFCVHLPFAVVDFFQVFALVDVVAPVVAFFKFAKRLVVSTSC